MPAKGITALYAQTVKGYPLLSLTADTDSCCTDGDEAMTEGPTPMCDRALEPPAPDGSAQLEATVDGRGFHRLVPDDGAAYAPVTDELLERVLHGLRRLAE